jgi:hypothetical protein
METLGGGGHPADGPHAKVWAREVPAGVTLYAETPEGRWYRLWPHGWDVCERVSGFAAGMVQVTSGAGVMDPPPRVRRAQC